MLQRERSLAFVIVYLCLAAIAGVFNESMLSSKGIAMLDLDHIWWHAPQAINLRRRVFEHVVRALLEQTQANPLRGATADRFPR